MWHTAELGSGAVKHRLIPVVLVQVRTKNFSPALDLKGYGGLGFRVKGDGLRYKCTIRTDTNWDGIGYTL